MPGVPARLASCRVGFYMSCSRAADSERKQRSTKALGISISQASLAAEFSNHTKVYIKNAKERFKI